MMPRQLAGTEIPRTRMRQYYQHLVSSLFFSPGLSDIPAEAGGREKENIVTGTNNLRNILSLARTEP